MPKTSSQSQKHQDQNKNFDTEIGSIEDKYGVDLGVRRDKKLGNYLKDKGYKSLADMLKKVQRTVTMARQRQISNFDFVRDDVLRENLDKVFDHIVELISLSESSSYDRVLKSSFRKTVIIYTASIIEALLLHILKESKAEEECASVNIEKKFRVEKWIYEVDEAKWIVLGESREERPKVRFEKMNLDNINKFCKEFNLIPEKLSSDVEKVRDLRNRQHLGGLSKVDRTYTKRDLEYVFSVARKVKKQARKVK